MTSMLQDDVYREEGGGGLLDGAGCPYHPAPSQPARTASACARPGGSGARRVVAG